MILAGREHGVTSTLLSGTDVIILAGGLGTRLAEAFPRQPKTLAPLAGIPILDHLLDHLRRQGARRVVLALGHLADQVCRYVGDGVDGLDIVTSVEEEPMGTAGAIAHALPSIRSDHVIVMNGDSLIEADLVAFVSWVTRNTIETALIATSVDHANRYGVLGLDEQGVVQKFEEKEEKEGPAWINAGVYWLGAMALQMIASLGRGSLEHEILPNLPAGSLHAFRSPGNFIDIGTPDSFARAGQWAIETTACVGIRRS